MNLSQRGMVVIDTVLAILVWLGIITTGVFVSLVVSIRLNLQSDVKAYLSSYSIDKVNLVNAPVGVSVDYSAINFNNYLAKNILNFLSNEFTDDSYSLAVVVGSYDNDDNFSISQNRASAKDIKLATDNFYKHMKATVEKVGVSYLKHSGFKKVPVINRKSAVASIVVVRRLTSLTVLKNINDSFPIYSFHTIEVQ